MIVGQRFDVGVDSVFASLLLSIDTLLDGLFFVVLNLPLFIEDLLRPSVADDVNPSEEDGDDTDHSGDPAKAEDVIAIVIFIEFLEEIDRIDDNWDNQEDQGDDHGVDCEPVVLVLLVGVRASESQAEDDGAEQVEDESDDD